MFPYPKLFILPFLRFVHYSNGYELALNYSNVNLDCDVSGRLHFFTGVGEHFD